MMLLTEEGHFTIIANPLDARGKSPHIVVGSDTREEIDALCTRHEDLFGFRPPISGETGYHMVLLTPSAMGRLVEQLCTELEDAPGSQPLEPEHFSQPPADPLDEETTQPRASLPPADLDGVDAKAL